MLKQVQHDIPFFYYRIIKPFQPTINKGIKGIDDLGF